MAPLRSTLGRSFGNLLRVGRNRDLAGTETGGAAKHTQLNSRYYGARPKSVENAVPIDATGGNVEFPLGDQTYHLFRAPGTFTVNDGPPTANAEIIVFGGGGSGGFFYGDGGGAGGGLVATSYPLVPGPYTVVVGEGAAGPPDGSSANGAAGTASEFYPTPVGPGEGASNMYARGGGGGGYKQAEPHPAPPGGFPWNPVSGTGGGGGQHNGSNPEVTPNFPTSTQHPAVTSKLSAKGGDQPYYNSDSSGGGGMIGGGELYPASCSACGGGGYESQWPGPGMYDAMPAPEQTAWGGTTWRDTLSPNGSIGGGGAGWRPTASSESPRSPGGGGTGGSTVPNVDAVNYTGSGGGVYGPTGPGDGADGGVWIRYSTKATDG